MMTLAPFAASCCRMSLRSRRADHSDNGLAGLSIWMNTDRLDDLYALLKERQLERARAALEGRPSDLPDVSFATDLYTAFYGQREFAIRDPNGVTLNFCQPVG
jgi:hypothetical protein